jgi:hypothetical protein
VSYGRDPRFAELDRLIAEEDRRGMASPATTPEVSKSADPDGPRRLARARWTAARLSNLRDQRRLRYLAEANRWDEWRTESTEALAREASRRREQREMLAFHRKRGEGGA